jgi:hypothetical protein
MNKKHRRNLKRLSKKFGISTDEAINKFYQDQKIDKNIIFSMSKKRNKGKIRKIKSLKRFRLRKQSGLKEENIIQLPECQK